jgi:hypothetical protein
MKQLTPFLSEKREVTIHTLVSYIRQYIREQWQTVLQEQEENLLRLFDKAGEYAYGVYFRALFEPLQEELRHAGIVCEPDFPGDFRSTSIEYWGPREERERCLWCVVRTEEGTTLGTIVTQAFHDHTRFRLPRRPGVFALEETEPAAILEALSHASVRLQSMDHDEMIQQRIANAQAQDAWEYSVEIGLADYLDSQHIEISEGMLDAALALWGRYGWELVAVVPRQDRMIAFFKRPAKVTSKQ